MKNPFAPIIRALSRRRDEEPSVLLQRVQPWSEPPRRGTRELLQAYSRLPWLRTVTLRVSRDVASARWRLYRTGGKKGERTEVLKHPVLDLLRMANPLMTGHVARRVTQVHLDLKGESFWVLERNAQWLPVQAYPVPPHWIAETPSAIRPNFRVSYAGWQQELAPEDVLWLRDVDPLNPYGRGTGIGESLADELDLDEFAAKRTKAFFYNGASPEVLVSVEGNPGDDNLKAAKEKWESEHRGALNAFRTFWTRNKLSVTRLDTSFRDMQLVELRKVQRDTVLQVFNIPPELVGILENANRSTIDSAYYLFAKGVVTPRLDFWKEEMNTKLLAQYPDAEDLELDYDSPVPEDREFARGVAASRPTAFTDNEVRGLAGFAPADGKDEFPDPLSAGVVPALGADPEFTRSLPPRRQKRAPPAHGGFGAAEIENVLQALRPDRLTVEIDPVFVEQVEAWSRQVLSELGASAKFDLLNPLIAKHLREFSATQIRDLVDQNTRQQLRDSLTEGVKAGESIRDLVDRVEDTFGEAVDSRAEAIARTEVVRSSNWATFNAQKISGVVDEREWVATVGDGRTRPSHTALNGVKARLDEKFTVNGHSADFPGGFGVAEEDINCRCTTVAVISDDLGDEELSAPRLATCTRGGDLAAVWRAYDAALVPWEEQATRALRRGFRTQLRDVKAALEKYS